MKLGIATLAGILVLVPGSAALAQTNEDVVKLQGDWVQVAKVRNGEKQAVQPKLVMTYVGTKYTARLYSSETESKVVEEGTVVFDTKKDPKTYDATMTGDFPDKGKVYSGIYKFDSNTFTTCVDLMPGKERPAMFASTPGSNFQLIVWERGLQGRTLADWIQAATSPDAKARSDALAVVGVLGPLAPDTTPAVKAAAVALKDQDQAVRTRAFNVLQLLSPRGGPVIPVLIEIVQDRKSPFRTSAAQTLSYLGPNAAKAVPALVEMGSEGDAALRLRAIQVLGALGKAAVDAGPFLLSALKDQDKTTRASAAVSLAHIGNSQPEVLAVLGDLARNGNFNDAMAGTRALAELGAAGVPALIDAVSDPKNGYRDRAIDALGQVGPAAEPAVPTLIAALSDKDDGVRSRAEQTLSQIGPVAIAPLAKVLREDTANVRFAAARSLAGIGYKYADKVLPVFHQALADSKASTREAAVYGVGQMGSQGRPAAQDLVPLLKDADLLVRQRSAISLANIGAGDATVLPILVDTLRGDGALRPDSAMALGLLGQQAAPAVPDLIKALSKQDATLNNRVVQALGGIGPAARDAVPVLIDAMVNNLPIAGEAGNKTIICSALRRIGPDAVGPLVKLLGAEDANRRSLTAFSLEFFGPEASAAVPALLVAMKDTDRNTAHFASLALWNIDPVAAVKAGAKKTP